MTSAPQSRGSAPEGALHLATIPHEGLLWDAYLDFEHEPRSPGSFRARLRFDAAVAASGGETPTARTTVIIIEKSYEEAVASARRLDDRQLKALLRSALPGADSSD